MPLDARPRTIYIHVPFCTHNCTFCNLNRRQARLPDDYADLIYHNSSDIADYRRRVEGPTGLSGQGFLVHHRYDLGYYPVGRLQFGRLGWADLSSLPGLRERLRPLIEALAADGLVELDSRGLSLTREGIFWGNNIGQEFAMALVKLFKGGDVIAHPGIAQNDTNVGTFIIRVLNTPAAIPRSGISGVRGVFHLRFWTGFPCSGTPGSPDRG
jgi:hypothetical protein